VIAVEQRRALCRQIGPTPWAVLEDMAGDAVRDDPGQLVVATNVRQLALNLGLSKDTVSRALRRLVDAGLVARRAAGRTEGGTFGPGVYVLVDAGLADVLLPDLAVDGGPRSTAPVRRRRQPAPPLQDSLFDVGTIR
jgi:DNA-binding transcriptional ArsR family regulator